MLCFSISTEDARLSDVDLRFLRSRQSALLKNIGFVLRTNIYDVQQKICFSQISFHICGQEIRNGSRNFVIFNSIKDKNTLFNRFSVVFLLVNAITKQHIFIFETPIGFPKMFKTEGRYRGVTATPENKSGITCVTFQKINPVIINYKSCITQYCSSSFIEE